MKSSFTKQKNLERFEIYKQTLIDEGYDLTEFPEQGKVSIVVDSFGIVAYYPKSNRLLIQKDNKWVNDGLNWIIENLL